MKEKLVKIECHCGGISGKHYTGDKGCLREVINKKCWPVLAKPKKGDKEPIYRIKDPLLNGGKVLYVGEFMLFDQWLYANYANESWTRPVLDKKLNPHEQLQKDYKELQEKYDEIKYNYAESCASAEKAIAELNKEKEYLIDEIGGLALQTEEMRKEGEYRDIELSENSVRMTALKRDLADMRVSSDKFRIEWIETNGKYLALKDIVDRVIK